MDWLEEKAEKFHTYIRSLSFRKAMIAYILILAAAVYGLSYLTMIFCGQWEAGLWEKMGETEIAHAVFYEKELLQAYWDTGACTADEASLLLIHFLRVWCPFIYAFPGIILAIFLFYQKRLAKPLSILEAGVENIRRNDLDFHVAYDSRDELGKLCDSVEEMRLELLHDKEEMWRLMERQKELNAAFAHDLRTPLTVLRGYTDFLARYIPQGRISREKLQDTLALMAEHLRRLEAYSRTMKGIRSIEEVPFTPEKTTFQSIDRKIEEVVFALNQVGDVEIVYRKSAPWQSGFPDPGDAGGFEETDAGTGESSVCAKEENFPGWIYIDDNLAMEVLENLLSNAIRYARERIEVMSDYSAEEREWLLTVRDDGPGFLEGQLEKALKPYYKEPEPGGEDEHFGIGLHICRELCRKHGGTLSAANGLQGGAVLTASFGTGFSTTPKQILIFCRENIEI